MAAGAGILGAETLPSAPDCRPMTYTMPSMPHARLALLALLPLAAAAQLPPNPATNMAAPISAQAPIRDAATRAHRAEVHYASGMMTVNAQNSSLNSILREISRQTGMKITGGVREERVFGHYGPATPATILATLLGGTGTNMILRQSEEAAPEELILTPRTGGPTPPSPNAASFDEDEGRDDQDRDQGRPAQAAPAPSQPAAVAPVNPTQPANNVLGNPQNGTPTASQFPTTNSVPADSLPTPSTTTPQSSGIVDTPNQSVTVPASSNSGSSSGQKTPEQIFQELQQLRQQQQKATTPQ